MYQREILHCDLDNFFASVEGFYNPSLKDKPFAVCGSVQARHGIVLAKNPIAKRYGVRTAEAIWQAKSKCPSLVIVEPHYSRYVEFSRAAREIYYTYTDMVEAFGIDECWLDVSGSSLLFGSGEKIAREINERVKSELGITVSVGASFNKCFAKLGSDMNKPDGVTLITRDNFRDKVWRLPAKDLLWVGESTRRELDKIGVFTIGDIVSIGPRILSKVLGKGGEDLWKNASGLDISPVLRESELPAAKSIGRSTTGSVDLFNDREVERVLLSLSDEVSNKLRECGLLAGTVQIHIRDSLLGVTEHQRRLTQPTRLGIELARNGMELFRSSWKWQRPVRSIGIRACELICDSENMQLCFDYDYQRATRLEALESSCDTLRRKYGGCCVTRAALL